MKVALIQFNATASKEHNVARATAFVRKALEAGAQFILLPELFNWRGDTRDLKKLSEAAETIPGASLNPLMVLARRYKAYILAGSVIERIRGSKKAYNTSVLLGPKGTCLAKYRKIHLFDARLSDKIIRESSCFKTGGKGVVALVNGLKTGLSVCYDLRFAGQYGQYAQSGAKILVVPSCFTQQTGQAHWEVLLRARAIENLCFVLAPNQVGEDARAVAAYGNSMVVAPWGEVLARGSNDKEEIIYAQVDAGLVESARQRLPGIIK